MAFTLKGKLGIPDSRYAAELDKRAAEARFAPDMEAEYDEFFLSERRPQLRTFNGLLCVLSVAALLLSLTNTTRHDALQRLRLALIALSCAALTWAAFSRLYQELYLTVARWASLVISVFGSLEIAHRLVAGRAKRSHGSRPIASGLFFMTGLRFGAAVQASLALVPSFTLALFWMGVRALEVAHDVGIVAIIC